MINSETIRKLKPERLGRIITRRGSPSTCKSATVNIVQRGGSKYRHDFDWNSWGEGSSSTLNLIQTEQATAQRIREPDKKSSASSCAK